MSQAADVSKSFGMKSRGYCFDFALRKLIIGEARWLFTTTGSGVDWTTTSIEGIRSVVADSGEHLTIFNSDVVACAASRCIFQRDDWAMMLSCFACLWNKVKEKVVDEGVMSLTDLLDTLRGWEFREFVREWILEHNVVPAPFTVTSAYLEKIGIWRVKPARKLKRQRTR